MTIAAEPPGEGFGQEAITVEAEPSAAATQAALANEAADARAEPAVGRFHNREKPSPAEMAEMLREVQDSLAVLDERLAGLEGAQDESSLMTRRLASGVAEMGQTLARRVRSLETGVAAPRPIEPPAEPAPAPAPTPPPTPFATAPMSRPAAARRPWTRRVDTLVLILGLAALLGLIAIGLWVFGRQYAAAGSSAKPAAPPATAPAAPPAAAPPIGTPTDASSTSTAQKTASPPSTPAPRHHILHPVRHTAARHVPAATPPADVPAPTGFRSFGPAATNSVQTPSS